MTMGHVVQYMNLWLNQCDGGFFDPDIHVSDMDWPLSWETFLWGHLQSVYDVARYVYTITDNEPIET